MNSYFALILGVSAAGIGGELFVRGAVGLAHWARIPASIIGTTVAAFATSSPEFTVSMSAALQGKPQIGLGDALGSNVVNIGLILAIALLFSDIQLPFGVLKRDFSAALFAPVITGVMLLDGVLSRFDGMVLLGCFFIWFIVIVNAARSQRSNAAEATGETNHVAAVLSCLIGLIFLVIASHFIVTGAKDIAASFGIDEFVIGATVVAIGTSMPELATTVISKIRKHDDVGLGTILGSNIFNGFWIVGCAAVVAPITVKWNEVAVGLLFGIVSIACAFLGARSVIQRWRGVLLLIIYVAYVAIMLQLR